MVGFFDWLYEFERKREVGGGDSFFLIVVVGFFFLMVVAGLFIYLWGWSFKHINGEEERT